MKFSCALLTGLLFICPLVTRAANIIWTNLSGGNWSAATNWSPNQVPTAADHAVITSAGNYTVLVDATVTLDALTVGGASGHQTLSNFVATLTLNGPGVVGTNATFALNGSSVLAGGGELTVAGRLDWLGGTMQGAGKTIIAPGATLDISGNSYHKVLYRALDLRGNGSFSGGTWLYGGVGAPFTIFSGSTFDLQGDQQMPYSGAGAFAVLNNFGTLRKSAGAGSAVAGFTLNNSGLVQAQSGTLSFTAGGWSNGQFDAANAAIVNFGGGTHVVTNGVNFTATGNGLHRVDAGTFEVATALTMNPIFELTASGVLTGNGNLTCASTLRWLGGTMQGAGKTIIAPSAVLDISGNSYHKVLYRALDLRGNGSFSSGTWLYGGVGAPFTIFSGSTFELQGDQQMPYSGAGTFAVINNFGTLRKSAGAGSAVAGFTLNNAGLVQSQSGTLSFAAGGWSSGQFDAANGAVVNFGGGTHVITNGVSFTATGNGLHRVDAGTFEVAAALTMNPIFELTASGVLTGNGNLTVTSTLRWLGGTMQGAGKTIIAPGAVLDISGNNYHKVLYRALDLRGNGTFSSGTWLYGGVGAPFTIFSGSTFDLAGDQQMPYSGAGTFAVINNFGTLRKSAGSGAAVAGFTLNNAGLVQSQSGTLSFAAGGWSNGQFDAGNGAIVNFGGGTHVVTNGVSFTATGSGFHRVDAGTFDVAAALTMNPIFELTASGVLTGNGNLTCASTLRWLGGTMQGAGKTIIASGATLDISGNNYHKVLYRALDLRGNGTFSSGTWLYGGVGAPFTIFSGSTFDLAGDQQMPYSGAGTFAVINNFGTLRKSAGAGSAVAGFTLNNSGLVQAQSGTLSFGAGGWSSGQFDAGNGAIVNFGGGMHTVTNGVNFTATGNGLHRVDAGTFDVATPLMMNPPFMLTASGILTGSRNFTIANVLFWYGGTMQGTGKTIISPDASLDIGENNYNKVLYRTLDLRGHGSFTGNTWVYGGLGAVFTIFNGAEFTLHESGQMPYSGAGAFPVLLNYGRLKKDFIPTANAGIGFAVTNYALVESKSGTLSFTASYRQVSGTTLLNGGGFGGSAILDILGGELRGEGNIAADVRNWADVHPGGPFGFLSISNSVTQIYSNTANGRLNLQLGGLIPGTNHDQVRINGQANLSGTINVDFMNGFVPAIGNSFTVMTYTARSGQFAGILSPPGITLQPAYFPTHLVLNAVAVTIVPPFIVTHPTNLVLKEGLTATFRVVASGTPQLNYQWQRNAIDIPGATSDTLVIPGVTVTNAGAYRVLVSNLAGITNSLSATLIVEPGFQTVEIETGNTNLLTGASFINGLNGAIVGRDGSMRITRDGGATWNVVNSGMTNITDVQFVGGAIFIVGGGAHTICVSYDGGGTWDAAYSGPERIFRLRFLSPNQGYAVGDGVILRWDGVAWVNDFTTDVRLLSVDYCGGFPVAVGEGGRIYQYTGTNWVLRHTEVNLATFNDVKFCGVGGTGIAVGTGGVIYQTTDCGLNWSPFTNPAFTGTLRSIAFGDCGTWWVSGDDGVILQSEDGGHTWGTLYTGTTQHIREVIFIDGYGYYIDDGGHVHRFVYLPIPQNLPPVITLVQPAAALTNWACTRLPLRVLASDPNGFIAKVEFFAGPTSIEVDTTYPTWTGAWTNCDIGTFTLTAVATDNRGATAVSGAIKVTTVHPPLHTLIPAGFMGRAPDAGFKLCMTGETGRQYEVYAHTNVVAPFATWEYLGLMSEVDRLFGYLDHGATNLPYRFYRAKQVP